MVRSPVPTPPRSFSTGSIGVTQPRREHVGHLRALAAAAAGDLVEPDEHRRAHDLLAERGPDPAGVGAQQAPAVRDLVPRTTTWRLAPTPVLRPGPGATPRSPRRPHGRRDPLAAAAAELDAASRGAQPPR